MTKKTTKIKKTTAFMKNGYKLHKLDVKFKNSKKSHMIYFFSKKKPKRGTPCEKPSNMIVGINKRTKLPYLKKKK